MDTEWFGMKEGKLHIPHGKFASLGCTYDGKTVYLITDENDIAPFMQNIKDSLHVYHNAKFDIGQLRRFSQYPDRKSLWDTMILEQIHFAGYYALDEFNLKALVRRYLDIYMSKEVRETFEGSTEMSKEQIEYSAVDVALTWMVYQEQKKVMDENDLNVWYNIDRCAVYSVLRMKGMKLDIPAWTSLYEHNNNEARKIEQKYEGINLGSWQQVLKELKRLGYTDQEKTNKNALASIKEECEFARDVLEYRERDKAAGTYGMSWIDETESDHRIYSDFYINGAATGRFSSSKPNVENIPVRDGPHFRKCFIPDDDYVYIDADFSAQEPRIWTYLSQDDLLLGIFQNHKDIYLESARLMFGWEMEKSDPRRKTRMKPTVLGAIFGLTEYGLLQKDQIPLEEGKELLAAFWRAYPKSKKYADKIRKTKDYVQTVYGRKYWINPYQQGHENNCLNSPVQGTAADIIKIAGYRFQLAVDRAGYSDRVFIVNYIHDEILVEAHKNLAEWTKETLQNIMLETAEETHDGVPADIEIKVGLNWAETH